MPFIIAEIGSNYHSLEDCISSIKHAKAAGANAAKFQLFTYKELYGFDGKMSHELPREWVPELKRQCDKSGIEFMCTAFSIDGFKYIDQFVNKHKIASSCNSTANLIKFVASLGKTTYISTGCSNEAEIKFSMDLLNGVGIPLFCVANYPAKVINLFSIKRLKELFGECGYSDHSIDVLNIPTIAIGMGASVLEKHFTIVEGTPDAGHSLNPHEFKLMVDAINGKDMPVLSWAPEEQPMAFRYRNRIIALKDINKGDKLVLEDNYGCYRSLEDDTDGINGFFVEEFNGAEALCSIQKGKGISTKFIAW